MKNDNTTCQDTVVSLDAIDWVVQRINLIEMGISQRAIWSDNLEKEYTSLKTIRTELEDKVKLREDFKFWKAKAVELAERVQQMREA
jgi:predicted nuclease with TOPRIM domain